MRRALPFWCSCLGFAVATACGGDPSGSSASRAPSGAPAGRVVDAATAGSISGHIVFEGTPPGARALNTSSDSRCAAPGKPARDESVIVADGGLDNVVVYIKSGLGDYVYDIPDAPAKLEQDGCVYTPHVLGLRVGQPLEVTNSDPTAHNVHAAAAVNPQLNTSQPFRGMKYTHSFSKPEVAVPFKCDIHPWMLAHVAVVDHPYFAVTRRGGRFELKDVPPGTYTVEAWHETLGTQTATVTLAEREPKEVSFTFKAS